MSRFSVKKDGEWWQIVITRPEYQAPLYPVWIVKGEDRKLLCQVAGGHRTGWDVVVWGRSISGPRLVEGFKTRWRAIQYAIQIREDINVEAKEVMRHDDVVHE